jgi:DNA helicase INO80
MVVRDAKYIGRVNWQYMILDEAQAIKSSASYRWNILLKFNCRNRLLLTGTPIQNTMAELWALLHFIMPTLFDSHEEFDEWFSKDIENHAQNTSSKLDHAQLSRLHMILQPFMLRRIKTNVEHELADKVEIQINCYLTPRQQRLYRRLRQNLKIDLLVVNENARSRSASDSLMNLVMQFRKICNHPNLLNRRPIRSPFYFEAERRQEPRDDYASQLVVTYNTSSALDMPLPRIVYEQVSVLCVSLLHLFHQVCIPGQRGGRLRLCDAFLGVGDGAHLMCLCVSHPPLHPPSRSLSFGSPTPKSALALRHSGWHAATVACTL